MAFTDWKFGGRHKNLRWSSWHNLGVLIRQAMRDGDWPPGAKKTKAGNGDQREKQGGRGSGVDAARE